MADASSKTILVTGGAGYIGSHTCKMLKNRGYEPVVFDNLSNGHRHAVKWGELIEGDLCDTAAINKAFKEHDFAAVIHFAGLIEVGESVERPEKYYRNNVTGALNLLQAMAAHNVNFLVFSGSCAIYGAPNSVPIAEDTPHNPLSPYGASKAMIEQILSDFSAAHNLRYVSCRYFNACGADPDLEVGEEHDPETHIIPRALMALSGAAPSFDIYGSDYETPDGTCVRDYIHVQDLASAHLLALEYLEQGGESTAVNLGTGTGYSVREILETVQRVTGQGMTICEKPRRPGDPPILVADPAKAKDVLGFEPLMGDLDTIIQTAWEFYKEREMSGTGKRQHISSLTAPCPSSRRSDNRRW